MTTMSGQQQTDLDMGYVACSLSYIEDNELGGPQYRGKMKPTARSGAAPPSFCGLE